MSTKDGKEDALGGLLALSGVDTSAFNRPKSLAGLKTTSKQSTPVQANASSDPAAAQPASLAGSPTKELTGPDPLSLDHLNNLLAKSASRASL